MMNVYDDSILCLLNLHRHRHSGLQAEFPPPRLVLGHPAQDLCVHLCLHHARPHHHCLLWPHDPAAKERTNAVGLPGWKNAFSFKSPKIAYIISFSFFAFCQGDLIRCKLCIF